MGVNPQNRVTKGGSMKYRIYFRHDDTKEESVREIEAIGMIYRVCDDHGHVVFGEPEPKKGLVFPMQGREPSYYN